MNLADLLSDMIASGADMQAVRAVVEAAKRQGEAKDQHRRELTAARVAKHRASRKSAAGSVDHVRNVSNDGNALHSLPSPPPAPIPPNPPTPPTPSPVENPPSPPSEAPAPQPKANRGATLPDDWQPNVRHHEIAAEFGLGAAWVAGKAEVMRDWAKANRNRAVGRKADWDATFNGFLRRDGPKEGRREILLNNPPGGRAPAKPASNLFNAFQEIIDYADDIELHHH